MEILKTDLSHEIEDSENLNMDNNTAQVEELKTAKAELSEKLFKYRLKKFRFVAAAVLLYFAFAVSGILSATGLTIFSFLTLAAIVGYVIVG